MGNVLVLRCSVLRHDFVRAAPAIPAPSAKGGMWTLSVMDGGLDQDLRSRWWLVLVGSGEDKVGYSGDGYG